MESKILKTASRADFQEIEAYLQLISPLDLVTRSELEKMLKKGD